MSLVGEHDTVASRPAEDASHAGVAPSVLRTSIALDALCIFALVAVPLWVFGRDSGRLGLYADDIETRFGQLSRHLFAARTQTDDDDVTAPCGHCGPIY